MDQQAFCFRVLGDLFSHGLGRDLVVEPTPVQSHNWPFIFDSQAGLFAQLWNRFARCGLDAVGPRFGFGIDGWLVRPTRKQLEPVVAGVGK